MDKKDFLQLLLEKGAMRMAQYEKDFFVFKSGRRSPNMINLRGMTDGESLEGLKKAYADQIKQLLDEGKIEDFDFIFGPAYAGISLACLACEGLYELHGMNKRYLYDRKESKGYGDKAMDDAIVGAGHFTPGAKILMIDDVITTGSTKTDAMKKLETLGEHKIVGLVLAVDRQEKLGDAERAEEKSATERLEDAGIKVFPILTMKDIFSIINEYLTLQDKINWIEYYRKYGAVKLG
ncbi:MAG: hypothetical protein HY364_03460 [Candidatus Aenigmarchaeota archaeon]|nr:hypothetical protein [Candidatus Aenigmarchaeota archaeon]